MKFWKGEKKKKRPPDLPSGVSLAIIIFFFFLFCWKIILQVFQAPASRLRFMFRIPPRAAAPRGSFCAGFVSMRGQENATRETEAPHQTSQGFSSCFPFPPSSLVCFHLATKNYRNPFNITFFLPSPFHLPPASQRDQMWKSRNPGIWRAH